MSLLLPGSLRLKRWTLLLGLCAATLAGRAGAEDACRHRGDLDTPFCDEDGDLLADTPKDPARQKTPDPLFFTNSPLEDPAVFKELMRPFVEHLAKCTARKVRFYDVYSSAAAIEAMRSGRMHLGTMSSGDTA
ncbi:MAG: PhnD/SsuA/transferrin family substrate-binding protein, partial [Acidobacteriota bacterium]